MSTFNIQVTPQNNTVVVVDQDQNQVVVQNGATEIIEVNTIGPQGVTGPTGPLASTNSGSFAITGSLNISGSVNINGTASINTLVVNQTQLSTGSNQLGDNVNDFQTLFGTVRIPTGSLTVTGSLNVTGSSLNLNNIFNIVGYSSISPYTNFTGINTQGGMYMSVPTAGSDVIIVYRGNSSIIQWYLRGDGNLRSWGNTLLGASSTSDTISARLQVRGSGTTSATTAFRVENANASASLVVNDTGSVLIGTTTDAGYKLDVNGTVRVSGVATLSTGTTVTSVASNDSSFSIIRPVAGSTLTITVRNNTSTQNEGVNITRTNNTWLKFIRGTTVDFNVSDTGNFLIGTTTDSGYKLDVSGSGRFTDGLTVTGSLIMSPTSSFVFPLSQSVSPLTGSAYWSGSFLFVYDGTRYRSSSFA